MMRLTAIFVLLLSASPGFCADSTAVEPADVPTVRFALVPAEPMPLPPIDGEKANALTLSEVEDMALAFHPAMRAAEGQRQSAQGQWLQVGLRPNPELGYSGEEIGEEGKAGKQGGFISQEFVTAGKLALSRAAASRGVSATEQRMAMTRLQVITTARIYYFDALAAERGLVLARQLATMGQQAVQASKLRLQAQEISRASLLQSEVEYESVALLVEQATNQHEAAWRRLTAIAGIPDATPQRLDDILDDPLPTLDWAATRERLLAESPELAELRERVEQARWAVQRAAAGRIPNVTAQSGVQYDNASGDTLANVQVSVPLPLFDRNQGNVVRTSGELTSAKAALEEAALRLEQRLAASMAEYATVAKRVARYRESVLPAAEQSRDLITQAYEQGEVDFLQLLSVQQTYTEKNRTYLQDLATAWKKWAEIDGLLVGTLPGSSN
jgi:outer membrane protein, heavy metal efflux system